jgi:hypothetical protein
MCGSCRNRRFGGTYRLHQQGEKNYRANNNVNSNYSNSGTLRDVTANIVPGSLKLYILMTEAIRSSETSVLRRAARRHITEYGILHSHRRPSKLTKHSKSEMLLKPRINPFREYLPD